MNKDIDLEQIDFKVLYLKYKEYILPSLMVVFALGLFIFSVIPQFQFFLDSKAKEKELSDQVKSLENNLTFVSNLNDFEIDSQLNLVNSTLPIDKDAASILNTISSSSNVSGVSLGDYGFQIGDLSTQSAAIVTGSFIQVDLAVNGDLKSSRDFIENLSKRLPLSESVNIKNQGDKSSTTVYFYHKPFAQIIFNGYNPIKTLSQKKLELLNELTSIQNSQQNVATDDALRLASPSAAP